MLTDHILYLNEWRDKNGRARAAPDTTTKNIHFLRLCAILKRMGIKNHVFPLALRDQRLKGVDPHALNDENDPDFTMRGLVVQEAASNIWYFLREVVRFPGGTGPVHMTFNRANCAMVWCFMQGISYIAIQPRQTGKTTLALILSCWCIFAGTQDFGMGMYTSGDSLRKKNLEAFRNIRDYLPKYFIVPSKGNVDNSEMIKYERLDNKYWTFIANKSEAAANMVGRGYSLCVVHTDEGAFCENARVSFPVLQAAMTAASALAEKYGKPYSILYTTTAGDPSTDSGSYAFDYVNKAYKMSETLYDMPNREATKEFLKKNSLNSVVNGTYSHQQLGFSNEWLLAEIKRKGYSFDTVMRDFLNRWYVGAGTPILPQETIKHICRSRAKDGPLYNEIVDDFVINWYVPENEVAEWRNKAFIVGLDASEMVDKDFTTAVAISPRTLETLFTFRCNNANITAVGRFFAELMSRYKKMVLIPEAKSSGRAITDAITDNLVAEGISPFTRIYNRIVQEYETNKTFRGMNIRDPDLYKNGGRNHVGFMTAKASRDVLYKNVLQKAAKISCNHIYDGTLIDELISLEVRNGRIDHSKGKHDDMVISWLLANWLVFYGANLKHYGLDVRHINNATLEISISPEEIQREVTLQKLYQDTKRRMTSETDPYLKDALRQRLFVLESKMKPEIKLAPISQEVASKGGYDLGAKAAESRAPDLTFEALKRVIF